MSCVICSRAVVSAIGSRSKCVGARTVPGHVACSPERGRDNSASCEYCAYYLLVCACLIGFFFFSSRRRHTRFKCDWSSDVCSSDLYSHIPGDVGVSGTGHASPATGGGRYLKGRGEMLALRRRGSSGPKRVVPNALSCKDRKSVV